jgi:hypothetical protein
MDRCVPYWTIKPDAYNKTLISWLFANPGSLSFKLMLTDNQEILAPGSNTARSQPAPAPVN